MVKGTDAVRLRAAAIRRRIEATVIRRAPQVMVKVTGGGRCIRAIAAHFRYISKGGRLDIEDQRGEVMRGTACVSELAEEWQYGGSLIPTHSDPGHRREAFNVMLSMPRGTDPLAVQRAAREFARQELDKHKYVMVLHDHQANPHVHISVRAESTSGRRLNPRKADLQRWRETFAEKLRGYGIDAEATRQVTRGQTRAYEPLWRLKASEEGRLRVPARTRNWSASSRATQAEAAEVWRRIGEALSASPTTADQVLAEAVKEFSAPRNLPSPSPAREEPRPSIPRDRDVHVSPRH